jgi:cytochrome c-type biogenesis protein CcmE
MGAERKNDVVVVVCLVAATCGIVALVFVSFREGGTYAKRVDQLAADPALVGRPVRAEGTLVHGTLAKRDGACEYRFRVRGETVAELPVHYATCALPDGFRDRPDEDQPVMVEGTLLADGSLEATQLFTKCPSRYDEKKRRGGRQPSLLAAP